jgi:hypothetical protein
MPDIKIDMNPIVAAVVKVMIGPYNEFLAELLEAGRVTPEEVEKLRSTLAQRAGELGDRVREEIAQSPDASRAGWHPIND